MKELRALQAEAAKRGGGGASSGSDNSARVVTLGRSAEAGTVADLLRARLETTERATSVHVSDAHLAAAVQALGAAAKAVHMPPVGRPRKRQRSGLESTVSGGAATAASAAASAAAAAAAASATVAAAPATRSDKVTADAVVAAAVANPAAAGAVGSPNTAAGAAESSRATRASRQG